MAAGIETTVFRSGNSDAVRLPRGFALSGKRVRLRRLDDGRIMVEPVSRRRWPPGFLDTFGRVTDDFAAPPRPAATVAEEAKATELFPHGGGKAPNVGHG